MSAASSEKQSAKSSLWSKVLLWVVVLLIGFLYIRSVAQREPKDIAAATEQQPAAEREAGAVGGTEREPAGEPETGSSAAAIVTAPTPQDAIEIEPAGAESTRAAEEQTPAPRAPDPEPQETAAERPVPVPAEPTIADTAGGEAPQEAEQAPTGEQQEQEPAAVEQEVSPEEAKAFAEAVVSKEAPEPAPEASEGEQEQEAAPAADQPTTPDPVSTPTLTPVDQRRSRILAEYEAMRKAAEAEWQRRGMQVPQAPYGGAYPGYGYPPYPYQMPYPHQQRSE